MINLQSIPLAYYSFSATLNFITCLFLAIFVFLRNPRSNLNRTFAIFCFSISQWSLFYILWLATKNLLLADLFMRTCMIGVIFLPAIFTHFILVLTRTKQKKAVFILNYLSTFIIAATVYTPLYATKGGPISAFPYWLIPGKFFPIHLVHFFINLFYSYLLILKALKREKGLLREQIRYIILGTAIGFLGGWTNYLYWYRIVSIPPFLNITAAFGVPFIAYAIIKYHLMDINIALTRAGIFAIVYFPVVFIPFWIASKFIHTNLWWIPILLMGMLATSGIFIYNNLRKRAEARLLAEDLKKYETLKRFARTLGLIKDLDKLLKLIVYRLVKTLKVTYGAVYLFEEGESLYLLKSSYGLKKAAASLIPDIPDGSNFIKFLVNWKKDVLLEDLFRLMQERNPDGQNQNNQNNNQIDLEEVSAQMQRLNASLLIPHFLENTLIGFLILGPKLSGEHYSESDIDVLTTLSRSAALAIDNALFMLDLKKTESELAETHRVAQLGYLASATGHQLSNVLNNIVQASYAALDSDCVLNSFKDSPQAKQEFEKSVNDIIASARDGGLIIDELRDYAQAERDKKFSPVNLKEVLDKTLNVLYIQAHKFQSIDIVVNISPDAPLVSGSFVGMQNVFLNMFNNGYDAILEKKQYLEEHPEPGRQDYKGKIEVNIARLKGNAVIHIIDDGKGIPADVQKRLFTPLYTTKASSQKREEKKLTGGTGIGLYAILVIIKNHGGTIKLEKTETLEGTDFLIQLPAAKEDDMLKTTVFRQGG